MATRPRSRVVWAQATLWASAVAPSTVLGCLVMGCLVMGCLVVGCGGPQVPEPAVAIRAYAQAVESDDPRALRALMTQSAQADLSERDVARLLKDNRLELRESATALEACGAGQAGCQDSTEARLMFADGSEARLWLEGDSFRLAAAGSFPAAPPSPEAALIELRLALERRNLPALLQLLEQGKRAEIAASFQVLSEALRGLDLASIETRGDRAQVDLPGGVRVLLKRVRGAWWIEDIE